MTTTTGNITTGTGIIKAGRGIQTNSISTLDINDSITLTTVNSEHQTAGSLNITTAGVNLYSGNNQFTVGIGNTGILSGIGNNLGDTTVWSLDTTGTLKTNSINSMSGTGVTFSDIIIATTNGIQFSDGLQTQAYTGGASGWDGIATSDLVLSTFDTTTTTGNIDNRKWKYKYHNR